MGKKGDLLTKDANTAADYLLAQLAIIDGISSKKMFGGHGLFHDGKMFGLVNSKGMCCLKVTEENRADYTERGVERLGKMPYYAIPEDVLEDKDLLVVWAQKAIEISKKKK